MKSKKLIIILIIAFVIISISIFLILNYKKLKGGNTIVNQSEENIINSILNIKAYSAKLDVTIETNKNKNKYVISQKIENGEATQEVLEPENIAGVITKYDGKDLKVINNKLNLETTFQNCQYIVENRLWLDSFIKEYKESYAALKSICIEKSRFLTTKEWNSIAKKNTYLSCQAMEYVLGLTWNEIREKILKEI